jgi:hypothetical protein
MDNFHLRWQPRAALRTLPFKEKRTSPYENVRTPTGRESYRFKAPS